MVVVDIDADQFGNQYSSRGSVQEVQSMVLPAGRYFIQYQGSDWFGHHPEIVTVESGAFIELDLSLAPMWHRVRLLRGGQPLADQKIRIRAARSTEVFPLSIRITTDSERWCEPGLTAGNWVFEIQPQGVPMGPLEAADLLWPPTESVVVL